MKQEFEILDYNPLWKERYSSEKEKLLKLFGENLHSIHHIGSTAKARKEYKEMRYEDFI